MMTAYAVNDSPAHEVVLNRVGHLAYYTYYWGVFLYWSVWVVVYSVYRLTEAFG